MDDVTKPVKLEPIRSIRAEGNNPTELASQVATRVGARGVPSTSALRAEQLKQSGTPESAKTAWEREQALGRSTKPRSGGIMRTIRVKSNSHRSKTEMIDDVILRFNDEGVAVTPESNRQTLERYQAVKPGRISIEEVESQVPSRDELLAAACAAMEAQTAALAALPEEEPVPEPEPEEESVPEPEPEEESVSETVKLAGPVSVGRDHARTESHSVKNKKKKK